MVQTKLFSDLYLAKFLNTLTKPVFFREYVLSVKYLTTIVKYFDGVSLANFNPLIILTVNNNIHAKSMFFHVLVQTYVSKIY